MTESKPQNRPLGYARASTYGQTLDAQLAQLRKAGCAKIYREKVTGARAGRRELPKLIKASCAPPRSDTDQVPDLPFSQMAAGDTTVGTGPIRPRCYRFRTLGRGNTPPFCASAREGGGL
jgi:hypothetical protein